MTTFSFESFICSPPPDLSSDKGTVGKRFHLSVKNHMRVDMHISSKFEIDIYSSDGLKLYTVSARIAISKVHMVLLPVNMQLL